MAVPSPSNAFMRFSSCPREPGSRRRRSRAWAWVRLLGWLTLPAWAPVGLAAETPELVKAMLNNAPAAAERRCSYTRIRIGDDGRETKRERYDAGDLETPWELLQVDGRVPTEGELRRYAREADDRDRRHPLAFDLRSMVDTEHWGLRSEDQTEAVYEFRLRPTEELDERLVGKVLGTLVVDKVRRQPLRITIENEEAAYIAPFVRVADYLQTMSFRWDEAVGASVLTETETRWRGRALGLKPLRKHKQVRYTDYRCTDEAADAAD